MDQLQVDQKTYQMPPKDGITNRTLSPVADIERVASILRNGLR